MPKEASTTVEAGLGQKLTRATSPGTWSGFSFWMNKKSSTALLRQSKLNNYGLYEVIPGIYQVRGLDLSDISFVRGKTGWIVFDPLVTQEVVRAACKLFQEHVGEGLPVSAVIYSHTHGDHWGGVRGLVDEADVRSGKVEIIAPVDFMDFTVSENVYAGNAMNRWLFYQYGLMLPASRRTLAYETATSLPPTNSDREFHKAKPSTPAAPT